MNKGKWVSIVVLAAFMCLPGVALAGQYQEAPMLADMVAAGNLPAVEDRIPKNPRVVQVFEEVGQYGGNWRRAYSGIADRWGPTKISEEFPMEYVPQADGSVKLELNWIDVMDSNDDASEWTFHIREGLRWSDGELVTTDDVRFWYEDYVLREDLFGAPYFDVFHPGGTTMELTIVDDLTFVTKFANPYPLFPAKLAGYTQSPMLPVIAFLIPEHYMRQYHPDYAPEGFLDAQIEKYGVKDWNSLWGDRGPVASWWLNPELPVLNAWLVTEPAPAPQVKMARNPYYHAVDPEGNQLPYIDTVTHDLFQDKETLNLWVVQGLIDMQQRHINTALNYTLFKENEEKGGYVMKRWTSPNTMGILFNQNHPDETSRVLFQDIRFREAMSVAIDREEYVDIMFNGLSEPRQSSPPSGTDFFDPEFETKWIEYDPERANGLLDEIGLTERDNDGYRLFANGERVAFTFTAQSSQSTALELLGAYWKEVGVQLVPNIVERSLLESMSANNEVMVHLEPFGGSLIETGAGERTYTSTGTNDRQWAPMWGRWFGSDGQKGEEPPADHPIREVWAAWKAANVASTLEEAKVHMKKMVAVHKENVWSIGLSGEAASFYIVSTKMGNVPEGLLNDDLLRNPGIAQPAQFFFKQ